MNYSQYYHKGLLKYSKEDHESFLQAKLQNINEPLPHLVHADKLEENGATTMGQHIREAAEELPSSQTFPYGKIIHEQNQYNTRWGQHNLMGKVDQFRAVDWQNMDGGYSVRLSHASNTPSHSNDGTSLQHILHYYKEFDTGQEANEHYENLQHEIEHYT